MSTTSVGVSPSLTDPKPAAAAEIARRARQVKESVFLDLEAHEEDSIRVKAARVGITLPFSKPEYGQDDLWRRYEALCAHASDAWWASQFGIVYYRILAHVPCPAGCGRGLPVHEARVAAQAGGCSQCAVDAEAWQAEERLLELEDLHEPSREVQVTLAVMDGLLGPDALMAGVRDSRAGHLVGQACGGSVR